jgi:predicted MFS family arabinose efflux permease
MVTLVAFVCGRYIEKFGLVKMYKIGALLFSLGFFISYLSNNAQVFLLSRVVEGVGFGISLISMRVEAVSGKDQQRINEDVAVFSIGVFSAVNIGSLLGGIIADNIGLRNVFMISSITSLIGALICGYFITGVIGEDREATSIAVNMRRILRSRRFIICCLLFLVPVKLMSGFLDYLFPVFAKDNLQWSYTLISRGYLLNSLLIIIAGANIVRFVNRKLKLERKLMFINLVIASSYFVLGLFGNTIGLLLGIMLISIIQSFAEGSFLELYYGFEATQSMGKVKSICCYSIIDRVFIIVIPYVFASLLGGDMRIRIIGFAGLLVLLLIIQSRQNNKLVKLESSN